jgi:Holliday junction resolvase RusA-like endonuclease
MKTGNSNGCVLIAKNNKWQKYTDRALETIKYYNLPIKLYIVKPNDATKLVIVTSLPHLVQSCHQEYHSQKAYYKVLFQVRRTCNSCPRYRIQVKSEAHDKELYQKFKQDIDNEVADTRDLLRQHIMLSDREEQLKPLGLGKRNKTFSAVVGFN